MQSALKSINVTPKFKNKGYGEHFFKIWAFKIEVYGVSLRSNCRIV